MANAGNDTEKKFLMTQAGLDKLTAELAYLKKEKRKEISEKLAEAISYGDLSENAEYDAAKNEQAFTEQRITEVEDQIKYSEIIVEKASEKGLVQIGSTVVLKFDDGEEHQYTIVGSTESDPLQQRISNESPVGEAILGKKVKDKVTVKAPGGEFDYTIVKVV